MVSFKNIKIVLLILDEDIAWWLTSWYNKKSNYNQSNDKINNGEYGTFWKVSK